MKVKFTDKLKIKSLSRNNLSTEMRKQSSRVYKAGCDSTLLEEKRDEEKDRLEYMRTTRLDNLISRVKLLIRKKWDEEDEGKLTEKWLDDKVNTHKKVSEYKKKIQNQRARLRKANRIFNISKVKIKALASKQEMLVNIGYNLRKEMDYNTVKESQKDRINNRIKED